MSTLNNRLTTSEVKSTATQFELEVLAGFAVMALVALVLL